MKLSYGTFDEDYWNNDFNISASSEEKKFVKRLLSRARRRDEKSYIKEMLDDFEDAQKIA
jgi:hypothetical protein